MRSADGHVACPNGCADHLLRAAQWRHVRLWKCTACGIYFAQPSPDRAKLTQIFDQRFTGSKEQVEGIFWQNREPVLQGVAAEIHAASRPGRILDIGCGNGLFLSQFFDPREWDRWGVEISSTAAQQARSRGLTVAPEVPSIQEGSFDVITILDTLYYLPQPLELLRQVREFVRPGGLLVVECPHGGLRVWRGCKPLGRALSLKTRHLLSTSDHVTYITPACMAEMFRRAGFSLDTILPVRANVQSQRWLGMGAQLSATVGSFLWSATRGRTMIAPRFVALGRPDGSSPRPQVSAAPLVHARAADPRRSQG